MFSLNYWLCTPTHVLTVNLFCKSKVWIPRSGCVTFINHAFLQLWQQLVAFLLLLYYLPPEPQMHDSELPIFFYLFSSITKHNFKLVNKFIRTSRNRYRPISIYLRLSTSSYRLVFDFSIPELWQLTTCVLDSQANDNTKHSISCTRTGVCVCVCERVKKRVCAHNS